jgi:CHAT domain-containing protein
LIDKLEKTETRLKVEHPEILSEYTVQVPKMKEIINHLEPGTLALGYFLERRNLTIFPLTRRGLGRIVRVVNLRRDLEKYIGLLPEYLESRGKGLRFLLSSTDHLRTVLMRLHQMLIEPLYKSGVLSAPGRGPSRLLILPHGILSYVPFHLLMDSDMSFLMDRFEISYAPSATAYAFCSAKSKSQKKSCLLFGTPETRSGRGRRLKVIEKEMLAIRRAFGSRCELFYKRRCTTKNFRRFAGKGDMLHFCGHGRLIQDSLRESGLQLWDDTFTMREMFDLDLHGTATVFLNSCVMMKNMVAKGNEIQGMVKAVFAAGAAALVVALWEVPDEAAALFAETFYESYVGSDMSRAASVRKAMFAVRERYEHPHFWGPYFLIGDMR